MLPLIKRSACFCFAPSERNCCGCTKPVGFACSAVMQGPHIFPAQFTRGFTRERHVPSGHFIQYVGMLEMILKKKKREKRTRSKEEERKKLPGNCGQ